MKLQYALTMLLHSKVQGGWNSPDRNSPDSVGIPRTSFCLRKILEFPGQVLFGKTDKHNAKNMKFLVKNTCLRALVFHQNDQFGGKFDAISHTWSLFRSFLR